MKSPSFNERQAAVIQEIYRRFPLVRGCLPRIQTCPAAKNRPGSPAAARSPSYLLVFQTQATTATGRVVPFYLRAVVDAQGKILKITTSR